MSQLRIVPPVGLTHDAVGRPKNSHLTPQDKRLKAVITDDQWTRVLGLVSDGVLIGDACDRLSVDRALLEGVLRSRPEHLEAYNSARRAAVMRNWTVEEIHAICGLIAQGHSVMDACKLHNKRYTDFIQIALRDPLAKAEYDEARRLRAELRSEEVIAISDDDSNDLDLTGKGNTAAVSRSDLKIRTRFKTMSYEDKHRFGEGKGDTQVNVQVNINHAERLEAARARARKAAVVVESAKVLDAEVVGEEVSGYLE